MNPDDARQAVIIAVGELAEGAHASIDLMRSASDYVPESLSLLILRESIESKLRIRIPDNAWLQFETLEDIVSYAAALDTGSESAPPVARPVQQSMAMRSPGLLPDGRLRDWFEVGMPMTGTNGLAENPLLKYLGHLRWSHLSALCGVLSRDVKDAEGHRLYPTFFYVDLQFPPHRSIGTFTENEQVEVICSLDRFGESMLDGLMFLIPEERRHVDPVILQSIPSALAAGIPVARLSCVFVKQFDGASWLKRSRPASGLDGVPLTPTPPDSYDRIRTAGERGVFERPLDGFRSLTNGWVSVEHALIPERDLNGAGLIYFANYPLFLDICERQVLKRSVLPFSDAHLQKRSLVRRESAYLNNASAQDTLVVEIDAYLSDHFMLPELGAGDAPVRLLLNYRMRRRSDGRLMMVSSAEKLITGIGLRDLPEVWRQPRA